MNPRQVEYPSNLKSTFASYGYKPDGWFASLVDVMGYVDDPTLIPIGEACLIGDNPIGEFTGMHKGVVAVRWREDEYSYYMPWEIRTVLNTADNSILHYKPTSEDRFAWSVASVGNGEGGGNEGGNAPQPPEGSDYVVAPIGLAGQVPHVVTSNSPDYLPDFTMKLQSVVQTADEFSDFTAQSDSMEQVFNTWTRFSHSSANQYPANANELTSWRYNSTRQTIESTVNSGSYIGFVSPKLYTSYGIDLTVSSTGTDNDTIALVIGYKFDGTTQHTLSMVVSTGGVNPRCGLVYNFQQPNRNMRILVDKSSDYPVSGNWNGSPNGSRIYVDRYPNKVSVKLSRLNQTDFDSSLAFEYAFEGDETVNAIFSKPCSYGFACYSQINSSFVVNSFRSGDFLIDGRNGNIYRHNLLTGQWTVDRTMSIDDPEVVGLGRFVFSRYKSRLYYNHPAEGLIQITKGDE